MSTGFEEVDSTSSMSSHNLDPAEPTAPPYDPQSDAGNALRSASYTSLPGLATTSQGIKRTFSENVLGSLIQKPAKVTPSMQSANVELFRRASSKTKRRMSDARLLGSSKESGKLDKKDRDTREETLQPKEVGKSMSGSFKNLARKSSWLPSSRSSSPSRTNQPVPRRKRSLSPKKVITLVSRSIAVPEPAARRTSQPQTKYNPEELPPKIEDLPLRNDASISPSPRAASELSIDADSETSSKRLSRQSSATSLKSRASNDQMYLTIKPRVPPLPKTVSPDRSSSQSTDSRRGRDQLWNAFRAIDGEYSTFFSKTSLQKAKVIRTVLLPFLTKHSQDPSTFVLRPEDLDRRVVILNRWWTGLLELLNGCHNQSISGTDRPAFLEAISELMMRPEWRLPQHQSILVEHGTKTPEVAKVESSQSIDSNDSDFLLLSIHQNIRNIFSQNLLSQMAFVVDKLSMRNAPASLVSFSGKACAYAFVYCAGVGDTLSRLWHIPCGTLRRVFSEYGVTDGCKAGLLSRELANYFPPPVRTLSFSSQTSLARHLRHKAHMPPGSGYIRWYGPWVNRWIGRDSDLFFVFAKHYHILVAQLLPRSINPEERVSIPGLAPLHAQLLIVLESTIYRQAGHFASENYLSMTSPENPDAMAPLPMVIPNATRSIGENRLVMLMRDLVNDTNPEHTTFVELLIGSFQSIMKAATRKISMYNNDACYVLCDILEELLPMISRYNRSHNICEDWSFWRQVFQQVMLSQTTMTQIRVIAFLYSMWSIFVYNEDRKQEFVLDWLLEPTFFRRYFSHWSPMVRHYFSRLVCWRIARCDGTATTVDVDVYNRLSDLLNTCWAHHQYLSADAEMRQISSPPTNPCSPAPGRDLLIIRIDSQPVNSSFTSFDKFTHSNDNSPYSDLSPTFDKLPEADIQCPTPKKRWSILRINPFSAPGNARPGEVTPPSSPLHGPIGSRFRAMGGKGNNKGTSSRPGTPPFQPVSFKFSLEFTATRSNSASQPCVLSAPVLPHNAQKILEERDLIQRNKPQVLSDHESLPVSSSGAPSSQNAMFTIPSPARSVSEKSEIKPLKPQPDEMESARYDGRALSEWHQVVTECRNFYHRRKQEGCPKDSFVEIPSLAVETFRMFG